jgi:hypothetical protein
VGVGVDVVDPPQHFLVRLVKTAVQDGDVERAIQQGGDDVRSRRARPADDERLHPAPAPLGFVPMRS